MPAVELTLKGIVITNAFASVIVLFKRIKLFTPNPDATPASETLQPLLTYAAFS